MANKRPPVRGLLPICLIGLLVLSVVGGTVVGTAVLGVRVRQDGKDIRALLRTQKAQLPQITTAWDTPSLTQAPADPQQDIPASADTSTNSQQDAPMSADTSTNSQQARQVRQRQSEQLLQRELLRQNTIEFLRSLPAGTVPEIQTPDLDTLIDAFLISEITEGDAVYQRINGKSYRDNPHFALQELRYVKVIHYNFEHQLQVGELIVNQSIAQDIVEIFSALLENEYEIQSLHLIDDYWTGDGDSSDYASIDKNNSSAFCYRTATGSSKLSRHAYGMAIDINPQQNPYVSYKSGRAKWSHSNANAYIDRKNGLAHVITHDDLCYRLFAEHGFSWGGDWKTIKDYQHFEK